VVTLEELELKLVSELLKNSRRSDRELAKAVGASQPTVSRLIKKLETQGAIREYTIVPDFSKLGFNLMSIILFKLKPLSEEKVDELHKAARELDREEREPYMMIVSGMGLGKNLAMLSFHQDYGNYAAHMGAIKNAVNSGAKAFMDVEGIDSFLVDLNYPDHYNPMTFSKIAGNLQKRIATLQLSNSRKLRGKRV